MPSSSVRKGMEGEETAVRFLKKKGFRIIDRNYRTRYGEIDIIARHGKELIFVEVKSGSSKYHEPYQRIDRSKVSKLMRAISIYLRENPTKYPIRFDVVSIDDEGRILHFEDVMEFDLLR